MQKRSRNILGSISVSSTSTSGVSDSSVSSKSKLILLQLTQQLLVQLSNDSLVHQGTLLHKIGQLRNLTLGPINADMCESFGKLYFAPHKCKYQSDHWRCLSLRQKPGKVPNL